MLDKQADRRPQLGEVATRLEELRKLAATAARQEDATDIHRLNQRRRMGRWLLTFAVLAALGVVGVRFFVGGTPKLAETVEPTSPVAAPWSPPAVANAAPRLDDPATVTPSGRAAVHEAPAPPPTAAKQAARIEVDVDVRSVIRLDGHVVARGRRAALEVTPGVPHLLVVAAPRHGTYHGKLVVDPGNTVELAVRLGAAHASARRRPAHPAAVKPVAAPATGADPNYTLNPFPKR